MSSQGGEQGRRRNVLLIYAISTLTTTGRGSTELLYPLNLDRLGFPLPLIGATVALVGFGALASRVPGGAWYRRSRARPLSAAALALMGLTSAGLGLAEVWGAQALLGAVHGFCFGLSTTFLLALLFEVRPRDESAAPVVAWYTAAISTGYGIAGPLGAQVAERLGFSTAFLASGLAGLAAAGLSLALRPTPEGEAAGGTSRSTSGGAAWGMGALFHLPASVWLATLLAFYLNFVLDTYNTFFPIYAVGMGISVGALGFFKSVSSLSATGIRFAAAFVFRFVSAGTANRAAMIATSLCVAALSVVTHELLLVVVFAILGINRGLIRVTSATMVAEEGKIKGRSLGMASAVYNGGLDAGSMLGPPVTGALAGALGIPGTFRVIAVALPMLYFVGWIRTRLKHEGGGRGEGATGDRVEG